MLGSCTASRGFMSNLLAECPLWWQDGQGYETEMEYSLLALFFLAFLLFWHLQGEGACCRNVMYISMILILIYIRYSPNYKQTYPHGLWATGYKRIYPRTRLCSCATRSIKGREAGSRVSQQGIKTYKILNKPWCCGSSTTLIFSPGKSSQRLVSPTCEYSSRPRMWSVSGTNVLLLRPTR